MNSDLAPVVNPSVVFIDQLLDEIASGVLRVPQFQRPFEWTPKQMTFLFDSIRMGYPIGSILLWETNDSVSSLKEIGGQDIKPISQKQAKYVLDGHQRLSSLFGVLRRPADLETEWIWNVYYDLREKNFIHINRTELKPHQLPMNSILRTMDFIRVCRRIELDLPNESYQLIEEAERVAQRFKNYRLPINVITGDLDQAVETFARLNTTGRSVSVDQMVSALTYREGEFHLDTRIDSILETLSHIGYGQISRRLIFRTIVAAMGIDVYKTDWRRVNTTEFPNLPTLVDKCESGLIHAAQFLHRIQVRSSKLLPYEPILMMLAEFFRLCPSPTNSQSSMLEKWFWKSSYTGWFTGASDTNINSSLDKFRKYAKSNSKLDFSYRSTTAVAFPDNFNIRSARVRMLLLFMLSLNPRNLRTGELLKPNELISQDESLYLGNVAKGIKSLPGNKLITGFDKPADIANALRSLDDSIRDEVLVSHAISDEAWNALRNGNLEKFVTIRNETLRLQENNYILEKGIELADVKFSQAYDDHDE